MCRNSSFQARGRHFLPTFFPFNQIISDFPATLDEKTVFFSFIRQKGLPLSPRSALPGRVSQLRWFRQAVFCFRFPPRREHGEIRPVSPVVFFRVPDKAPKGRAPKKRAARECGIRIIRRSRRTSHWRRRRGLPYPGDGGSLRRPERSDRNPGRGPHRARSPR